MANTVLCDVSVISVMGDYERFHNSEDTTKNCSHVLGSVAGQLAITGSLMMTRELTSGLAGNLGFSREVRG